MPATWERDGIGIDSSGLIIIRCDDTVNRAFTRAYLLNMLVDYDRAVMSEDRLKEQLKFTEPAKFVPEMVAELEAKAERYDRPDCYALSAAYSDAARMLRKAMRDA